MSLKTGLNNAQVLKNQRKYGPNELVKNRRTSLVIKFLKKLANPLILILLFSSILSAFLGQRTDFYIILLILFVSVILDVYQEHQAQNSADELAKKVVLKAMSSEMVTKLKLIPVKLLSMIWFFSVSAILFLPTAKLSNQKIFPLTNPF